MADENETKIRDAVGPNGTESPAKSPVDVLAMSFAPIGAPVTNLPPITGPDRIALSRTGFNRTEFMKTPALLSREAFEQTFVYAFKCEKFVKIGIATDVEKRRLTLTVGNPFPITFLHAESYHSRLYALLAERAAHKALSDAHHDGEWFKVKPQRAIHLLREIRVATDWLMPLHKQEIEARRVEAAA